MKGALTSHAKTQFYFAKRLLGSDPEKAVELFKKLAKQDYSEVQTDARYMLGKCYENGCGVKKSYSQAIRWYEKTGGNISNDLTNNSDPVGEAAYEAFRKAIEGWDDIDDAIDNALFGEVTSDTVKYQTALAMSGSVEAQKYLMKLYDFGAKFVDTDLKKSAYWAEKAARSGDAEAMDTIGDMYYYGRGVMQNCEKALFWFEKAANQGSDSSAHRLGRHYESKRHHKEAAKWFAKYAEAKIRWRNERLGWESTV